MKLKIIITTMALTAVCLGVHAQEKKTNPNPWFVQGQMGASYSTGDADFGKLLAPTGAIAVGKYFSPVWGARLAISGWRGRVGSEISKQAHGFYYGAATVDGLMNLSQLIRKYPERLFDLSVIAGIGFNRTYSHSISSFMGRLGLQGALRLNDALDFNIEALANGVSDRWNGRDDHSFDTYFTLSLGLTYKFKTGYKCITCISEEYPEVLYTEEEVNQLVNEQRSQVTKEVKEVMMQKTDTVIIKQDCPPTKVVKGIKSHVAFGLGRTNVAPNQEMNVLAIADYMKQFPESKATVTGFADNGTGSRDINRRLAKQRAEAVAKQLIEKYGISRDRLTVSSMQDKEQPFQTNDWKRVVIIIADEPIYFHQRPSFISMIIFKQPQRVL